MISLAIILILAWSFYIGYSRGLVLQVFYSLGSVIALVVATATHKQLAGVFHTWVPFANATQGSKLYYFDEKYLFDLDKVFYAGLSFLLIYVLVYAFFRFLGIFVHLLEGFNPGTQTTNLISGGLAVLVTFLSVQIVMVLLSTIPLAVVQDKLHSSLLANIMIQYTPFTSGFLKSLWLSNIAG
ncbi:CvpA family protein [Streptococcus ruminantium]|uniref:CvpA family protein n=1 Tax=Streptococcus ruminantium TaxID=1917441 RepID=UPI00280E5C03|nr:CvpA family protein [Streptococcus ruminantium]MDQ8821041.1 CvpA family protein [Streptococcus ruminantium]MDQ8837325.1 CvpA family protein [Streptococcus ruminantium]